MNQLKIFSVLICLSFFAFFIGCLQENNTVSGEYVSERNNMLTNEYIVFNNTNPILNEGSFSHENYNNSLNMVKMGTFRKNDNILTLTYDSGLIIQYTVTPDGHVLIPINENGSFPASDIIDDRFMKKLYHQ